MLFLSPILLSVLYTSSVLLSLSCHCLCSVSAPCGAARTNGYAKKPSSSSSRIGTPTNIGSTQVDAPTSQPTIVIIPVISFDRPTPTIQSSILISSPVSSTPLHLESLSQPIFTSLQEPFEYPHQLIPVDKTDPAKVFGNGYTVQLSPTISTVFVYDVRPKFAGKACTLALHMPPPFPMPEMAPVHIRSPGGVSVSRLINQVPDTVSMQSIGNTSLIGTAPLVEMASQYNVARFPCEAGQKVGYRVDSVGGFEADWFQLTYPALGLFLLVR